MVAQTIRPTVRRFDVNGTLLGLNPLSDSINAVLLDERASKLWFTTLLQYLLMMTVSKQHASHFIGLPRTVSGQAGEAKNSDDAPHFRQGFGGTTRAGESSSGEKIALTYLTFIDHKRRHRKFY